ncbi:M20 family metallopeptidase [Micromonospora sp. NPDC048830]|uniref:M20 metallopeptidase family protein n=1 Tax=Micromonospora sp. NPDC048830 TaxID=3364257 RepID=UPI00371C035F
MAASRDDAGTPAYHHLFQALDARIPEAALLRERLHRQPRVSGQEDDTLATLLEYVPIGAAIDLIETGGALVRVGRDGPSVALRAELDALPIVERTGAPFASVNGAMHACGHDVHMAAVIAVLNTLAGVPDLPAPVVAVWQPREETLPSGAIDLLARPQWARHNITAVIGAHVQPALNSLKVTSNEGTVNAASDEFTVSFNGRAAHGAYPHLSADPVLAASAFVLAAQQIVARNVDPRESAVVSVGAIHGGEAPNVIPAKVDLAGTIRTSSPTQQAYLHGRVRAIAESIATAYSCTTEVDLRLGNPPLVNDAALARTTASILRLQGFDTDHEFRSFGADDFAYYGRAARILMLFVGTSGEGGSLHSDRYLPDEDAVRRVAHALLAGYLAASAGTEPAGDVRQRVPLAATVPPPPRHAER